MIKPWSISTTVRNPDRLRDFLSVLKLLEGEPFNTENQIKYQILLIRNKVYKPKDLTSVQEGYFQDFEKEMPFAVAQSIFNAQNYVDPAMRGRNSVAPLNKMGLCVAKNATEMIKITPLGEYFLSDDYDLGKLFFIHFLKWQLPNPDSRTFRSSDGFAIKPFIGTLHLIKAVNIKWQALGNNPIGISKEEFSLFAPTLIHYLNIDHQVAKLIEYRIGLRRQITEQKRQDFREEYRRQFGAEFLGSHDRVAVDSLLKNLKDYGDNAIRYFRLTRFIYIRGGGFYIDLEVRRAIELDKLLATDDASPLCFGTTDEYLAYLADINQPVLPWETEEELRRIAGVLNADIYKFIRDLKSKSIDVPPFPFRDITSLKKAALEQHIENLRTFRRRLHDIKIHFESQDLGKIEEYITELQTIHDSKKKKSIELEKFVTLALNALNDALAIKPNYPVGDDNEPTFTAPAYKPDIECFYEMFNSVCEVTMLANRSQWYNEGQPVMRHVRGFENSFPDKTAYCLFIAPKLHQDTIETFWFAVKYEYKGSKQKIIPLSITQFVRLLKVLVKIKRQGRIFEHTELRNLYDRIIELSDSALNSGEWIDGIPNIISDWESLILSN